MVLGAGEAFTGTGMLTAGKGNMSAHSVFSLTHRVHFRPVAMNLNSRSDITISGFTKRQAV